MCSTSASPAVALDRCGIRFFLNLDKGRSLRKDGLKALAPAFRKPRKDEFWALRDITLEIERGEIFGIIGGNGAGKSTLLKIIAGIFPHTEGGVRLRGTIAPLIELGAAFNPELTGAENIYLTGSIFRIPRRVIRENFDRIVDFSGIRKFIDSPVKNYSSGMFIRLAFSIIIFFQPDIVLIDEVFSVGDAVFQQKSFEKILSFKEKGAAIVLVTHDLNLVGQICGRALVLSRGRMSFLGPSEAAIDHYRQLLKSGDGLENGRPAGTGAAGIADSRRWGNRQVEIRSVRFVDENGTPKNIFYSGDYFEAQISFVSKLGNERPVFGAAISTIYKMLIYGPNTLESGLVDDGAIPPEGVVRFIIPKIPLFEGDYLFSASCYDPSLSLAYDHHEMMYSFRVAGRGAAEFGCVRIDSRWEMDPGVGV